MVPCSEAVKDAANVFYWIIGALLILPFLIFYINLNNTRKFAEEFARKKDRLKWLSKKLDEGSFSPSDLSKALRSVSTLDWEEALQPGVSLKSDISQLELTWRFGHWTPEFQTVERGRF